VKLLTDCDRLCQGSPADAFRFPVRLAPDKPADPIIVHPDVAAHVVLEKKPMKAYQK